ncbi:MAG: tRNA-dihydrouridine synthase, partial [Ignavibacteriales bacterium]|nr:tRNA-dihydrouridine synthase [Ignavibacteriales bacterium]
NILEIVKRLEDVGVAAMTIHCRTRVMGHSGDPDWEWIEKIKNTVSFPIILNGGIMTSDDVVRAFKETPADAVMIARGAIGNPWIFSEAKAKLAGQETETLTAEKKIKACLQHLYLGIPIKTERRSVLEHRKFYSGYLKGMRNASQARAHLMTLNTYVEVEEYLLKFSDMQMHGEDLQENPV